MSGKVPCMPFKRYWVVKIFDQEINKEVFCVVNPKWCEPAKLKCLFPGDLTVCAKVQTRAERMKMAESDWVQFDYSYLSQTGMQSISIQKIELL